MKLISALDNLAFANVFAIIMLSLTEMNQGVELTFELQDNAKDCFYEHIDQNVSTTLEYQVISGGQYDVDVTVLDPAGVILFNEAKSQYNTFKFVPTMPGVHAVCFSNEFSTFAHKIVYMDLVIGEEVKMPNYNEHNTVMTLLESTSMAIHYNLKKIMEYQTHHRLREATSRKFAEDLNEVVFWWGLAGNIFLFTTLVIQVFIIKNFFRDGKTAPSSRFVRLKT